MPPSDPTPIPLNLREQHRPARWDPQGPFRRNPAKGFARCRLNTDGSTSKIKQRRVTFHREAINKPSEAWCGQRLPGLPDPPGLGFREGGGRGHGRAPGEAAAPILSWDGSVVRFWLDVVNVPHRWTQFCSMEHMELSSESCSCICWKTGDEIGELRWRHHCVCNMHLMRVHLRTTCICCNILQGLRSDAELQIWETEERRVSLDFSYWPNLLHNIVTLWN